ncbi:MAG: RICIN domain-containing protein [Deltaproteobacteria bacterium]|nr:RICIN domain-containing protein [Deltaproteobacteria bacterium]
MYAERVTRKIERRLSAALATTALALVAGCVGATEDDSAARNDEATATMTSAFSGPDTFRQGGTTGLLRVSGASVRGVTVQGALVGPTLALISRYSFDAARRPLDLTVETQPNSAGVRETARVVDVVDMPRQALVLLSLAAPLAERPIAFDLQNAGVPIAQLRCKQLRADGSQLAGNLTATPAYPDGRLMVLNSGALNMAFDPVADLGMSCGDSASTLGLLVYANPPTNGPAVGLVSNVTLLRPFLAGQPEVFAVRADPLTRPFSIFVTENGVRRCLSVSTTQITTADCDSGLKEQEFYFDRRPAGPDAIVSAFSGKCLAGGFPLVPTVALEARTCDQSSGQSFAATLTASGEVHYVQSSSRRCLSKTGTAVSLTADCRDSPTRSWSLSWH